MDISGCCGRKIRFPAVAGTFYPADKDELAQELKSYYKEAESMVKPLEDAQTAIEGSHTTLDGAPAAAKASSNRVSSPFASDTKSFTGRSRASMRALSERLRFKKAGQPLRSSFTLHPVRSKTENKRTASFFIIYTKFDISS
jgi:hypothetical protein